MKPIPRNFTSLAITILLTSWSLSAQNDGYQKAGNNSNYATPADQAAPNRAQTPPSQSQADVREDDALAAGNFVIGSGFGYVNSVTTIQIDNAGVVQKGGNAGYQLHLTPTIGYFVARNFAFGLGMDYLVSSSKDNTDNTANAQSTSDTKLLFGPYARLYFPFAGDQALFLGGVYAYGKSETEIADGTGAQRVNTTLQTFGVGPGYAIFSNGRVSLETQVKYNYGISRNELRVDSGTQSTRTLTTAWDFVVGLHFYFSRNRA
jgi:hypothetical protein